MGKVLSVESLLTELAPLRGQSTIVMTNGCFDILHVGHLRYLQTAKALGDILVIAVNSDASVRRLKGPERPIVQESDRAEILAGLGCVDYVVIFDTPTPEPLIEKILPNINVKGDQYQPDTLPEAPLLKSLGITLALVPMVASRSSTNLIEKIKSLKST
jgi:rfaE bifunctional protein nucleotidyltransferase chain/domain